ncbi:hypothetical protein V6N13_047273 [Hibiscus sabdariffa]
MSQQLELALPRFIAFGLNPKGSYLHQHFQNNKKKFAKFEGRSCTLFHIRRTSAESPYAKFEVEFATADHGLFHIRSCQNNKYLERKECWITATAKKKEEDQSKESCTLFKSISVDPVLNTVRIVHVRSGYYLCSWGRLIQQVRGIQRRQRHSKKTTVSISVFVIKTQTGHICSLRLMTLVIQLCHQRLLLLQTETSVSSPLVLINSGGVALTGVEWGETKTSTTVVEVVVPAMTKVTVNLVATKGTCDVPFTYMQRDTLYDGSTHTSEIEGNTYTGSNYYNINFVTKAKKLG